MDARLLVAAQTGDLALLRQLLHGNPLILEAVSLHSAMNPLHIASGAGRAEFVREMMMLRPGFAKELNQDGYSPLHIAAANGHTEVVRELIRADPSLGCFEGRDQRTPLHLAAAKGRAETVAEILLACPQSIESTTIQGETALHVAVKYNQVSAAGVLLDCIMNFNKDCVLNIKDELGNTVLHLAAWKKQRQVIELLVRDKTRGSALLDVNAINHNGLSALDMLLIFPSEAGDREIVDFLRDAGAKKAGDQISPSCPNDGGNLNPPSEPENLVEYFKFKMGRDSPSEARSVLLVIAVLFATATFQVGLNPPSGIWQDSYFPEHTNSTLIGTKHLAGWSILGTSSTTSYLMFVVFNTVGFNMSLHMISVMISKFPFQFELGLCMMALFFSYNTALINMSPETIKVPVIVITSVFNLLTIGLFGIFRKQLPGILRRGRELLLHGC